MQTVTNVAPTVTVTVRLGNPTPGALNEFTRAVEGYAEALRVEAEKQALTRRPPGMIGPEVGAESVVRAKDVLKRYGERAKPTTGDVVGSYGVPIFSCSTGIFAVSMHSWWESLSLIGSIFCGAFCLVYLWKRRLLL